MITIAPYPTELTDQDITVYATVDKGYLNAYSYTFTENGSFTFIAVDAWGNKSTKTVVITNIDKELPVITISDYIKTPTNQSITVYATVNKGTLNASSHTFTENGEFTFVATDSLGRTTTKTVTITNIDKIPPVITIGDYIKTPTNQNITVTATTNEGVLNATSYTFTQNGSFTFRAVDEAGNVTEVTVVINNIRKEGPSIILEPYNTEYTNQDVVVTATVDNGRFLPVSLEKAQLVSFRDDKVVIRFVENETVLLEAEDEYGNKTSREIEITNINKIHPVINLSDYPTGSVNRDITVTATAVDAFGNDITDRLNATSHTFTENGSFTFFVTDKWGNTTMRTVVINNINKIAPKITIHPYNTEPTNQDVTVTASVDRGTLNVTSYTFTQNGSFTFVAEDEYGNRSEETVTITNIDKEGPTFEVFKSPKE